MCLILEENLRSVTFTFGLSGIYTNSSKSYCNECIGPLPHMRKSECSDWSSGSECSDWSSGSGGVIGESGGVAAVLEECP